MQSSQYVPSFYFAKFAQAISSPYTALDAYKAGNIDRRGNVLKAEGSIEPFEYLIIKLKKIFEQLPQNLTKAQLHNYLSALQLFTEEAKAFQITESEFAGLVESHIHSTEVSYIGLLEDMAVGGGGGAPGTLGTPMTNNNTGSVLGFEKALGAAKPLKRKPPVGLENIKMFDVCSQDFDEFKSAKAWQHAPEGETKNYLQRYQRRNPNGKMALRTSDPVTGKKILHWINYEG